MNLTKKYMEKQGTLGYLHSREPDRRHNVVLLHAKEGCVPEHWYCDEEEADRIIEHWGATGDFIIRSFNFATNQPEEKITQPDGVIKSYMSKTYFRRMYPDQPTEKHGG